MRKESAYKVFECYLYIKCTAQNRDVVQILYKRMYFRIVIETGLHGEGCNLCNNSQRRAWSRYGEFYPLEERILFKMGECHLCKERCNSGMS